MIGFILKVSRGTLWRILGGACKDVDGPSQNREGRSPRQRGNPSSRNFSRRTEAGRRGPTWAACTRGYMTHSAQWGRLPTATRQEAEVPRVAGLSAPFLFRGTRSGRGDDGDDGLREDARGTGVPCGRRGVLDARATWRERMYAPIRLVVGHDWRFAVCGLDPGGLKTERESPPGSPMYGSARAPSALPMEVVDFYAFRC